MNLCVLGVIPFLFVPHIFAIIVFFNGVLFHGFFKTNVFVKWYDIVCNACMIVACNILYGSLCVHICSALATFVFVINKDSNLIHVVGVQWVLLIAMIYSVMYTCGAWPELL